MHVIAAGASVHRSVSHLDTSTMHMAGGGECGHPNPNRSSMSHKPPLSPHYSSAQPLVDSFSANFITFGADRVQSSPCIMQTDHAESHENNRPSHELMQEEEARTKCLVGSSQRPAGTDTFVLQGNTKIGASDSLRAEPCDLWSVNQMNDCAVLDAKACYSAAQEAVSPMLEELGSTSLKPQSGIQSSTVGNGGPQQAAGMQLCCDRFDNPGLQGRLGSGQALADDDHMACCSNSAYAVEVAAAAASLSGLPAASSPCCTFLLPTALSQGISASPAPSGDSGSDGSARRKSFSPLESGPVSILPLVENALIGLPSVSCSTLAKLIAGQHDRPSIDVKIVDCRWGGMLLHAHCIASLHWVARC